MLKPEFITDHEAYTRWTFEMVKKRKQLGQLPANPQDELLHLMLMGEVEVDWAAVRESIQLQIQEMQERGSHTE